MFKNILKSKTLKELLRTYIVGAINLTFGLVSSYFLQFYLLAFLSFPTRTYITNLVAFFLGVV